MLSQLAVTFVGQSIKAGRGLLAQPLLATAVIGSVIGVNFVGKGANASLVAVDHPVLTPAYAADTNSGGLALAGTDITYDTIKLQSPYRIGSTTWGLKTGTGVVWDAVFQIIQNPKGASFDCTKVGPGVKNATGGTLLFNNITATGSTNIYSTPFVLGPGEQIKCATRTNPNVYSGSSVWGPASFSGSLDIRMSHSRVIN